MRSEEWWCGAQIVWRRGFLYKLQSFMLMDRGTSLEPFALSLERYSRFAAGICAVGQSHWHGAASF